MIFQIIIFVLALILLVIFFSFTSADRHVLFGRTQSLEHDGLKRTYRLHIPNNPKKPSLVIALHGLGGDGRQMAYFTSLHNVTDNNVIVAYPDASPPTKTGTLPGWNVGFCCGSGWLNKVDDVGFIKKMVAQLSTQYDVNEKQIYVTGFSNGAMMAQRLVIDLPNTFAGFASVAGSVGTRSNALGPKRYQAGLLIHGQKDKSVPFEGGASPAEPDFIWRSFDENVRVWEKANNCTKPNQSQHSNAKVTRYESCKAELQVVSYPNNGHTWPDWRIANFWHRHPEGSQRVANFFKSISER